MGLIQGDSYEHYILRADVLVMATEYGRDFLINLPRVLSSLREIFGRVSIVKELPCPRVSRETRDADGRPCLIDADGQFCLADRSPDNPFDEKK